MADTDGQRAGAAGARDSAEHRLDFPRGAPLVTAGGLVFFATGSDRRFRAYDRDNGRELWSKELAAASEGMPATYATDGRQFIVVPVAAGGGLFAARFGGPPPAGGRGAASTTPGQYVAVALKGR